MNKVQLIGRNVRNLEIKQSQSGMNYVNFCLAVQRRGKEDGTDFIDCVAFGKTAENIVRYIGKGDRMAVCGRIQTGSYKKQDGMIAYTFKVVVDDMYFIETRKNNSPGDYEPEDTESYDDDELPF